MEIEVIPMQQLPKEQNLSNESNIISHSSNQQKTISHRRIQQKRSKVILTKRWLYTCRHSEKMAVFIPALLISTVIAVGVLTVYFTSPKPSEACNLTFRRTMKSTIISNPQPRSVALGDLNNDHNVDIVIVNSGNNTIGIFFARDDGTFQDQEIYFTGSQSRPYSVVVDHFNSDTYLDIAVPNYGVNNILIFFGNGKGTFTNQQTFSLGSSRPYFITTGDFNRDGQLDIAVANYRANNVGILFGGGNRTFNSIETVVSESGSFPYFVVVADINKDQYMDIVVSYSGTDKIAILLGSGNGTFPQQTTYSTDYLSRPYAIAIADLNNDNRSDIVITNSGTSNILILYDYENGTFRNKSPYYLGYEYHPYSIAVTDLDGNGWLDIAIACYDTDHVEILMKMC